MPRRLARATAVLTLSLALLGCGEADGDGNGDGDGDGGAGRDDAPAEPLSACGELTDAEVERLTGVAVTHEERELPGGSATCTFSAPEESAAVTVLAAATRADIDALVRGSRVGNEDETTTEEVEVRGTEAAVLVTDRAYDLVTTSLVATTGDVGYTVYGSGPTAAEEGRIAVAALTVLLGGTSDAPAADAARQPCDLLTAAEVEEVLGGSVTAEPGELDGTGLDRCSYDGGGTDVSLYALDRSAPLDSVVATYEKSGSRVEELEVEGLLAAYLVAKPTGTDSVDVYAAAPGATVVLSVRAADGDDSAELARELVPLLAS